MKIIRRGVTRTVILAGRWAIKLPSMRGGCWGPRAFLWSLTAGIQANLSEWEWSGQPGTCPVLWSLFGLANLYPRCTPVPDGAEVDYDAIGFPHGGTDRKPENVGYLGGRLVWLDYAQTDGNCAACRRHAYATGQGLREVAGRVG